MIYHHFSQEPPRSECIGVGTFRMRARPKDESLNRAANIRDFCSVTKYFLQFFFEQNFCVISALFTLARDMFDQPEILLLKGFCSLSFGDSKENVIKKFGEPEEIQNLTDDILNNNSLVYHYWEYGFSLFFDTNKNQAFCNVEIDNKETLLFGIKIFSLKEKEIIALMLENGYELSDSEMHQWGEKRISFDSAGLDCYFENNRLVSVNFGVLETDTNFYYFPN